MHNNKKRKAKKMHERNYIDTRQAQAIRREVRRLISREYSRNATVKVLAEFEVDPSVQDGVDAEAIAREFVDRLRNLPDSTHYTDALQDLAACAYAENKVEFQRGKIERRGYRLSDSGRLICLQRRRVNTQLSLVIHNTSPMELSSLSTRHAAESHMMGGARSGD